MGYTAEEQKIIDKARNGGALIEKLSKSRPSMGGLSSALLADDRIAKRADAVRASRSLWELTEEEPAPGFTVNKMLSSGPLDAITKRHAFMRKQDGTVAPAQLLDRELDPDRQQYAALRDSLGDVRSAGNQLGGDDDADTVAAIFAQAKNEAVELGLSDIGQLVYRGTPSGTLVTALKINYGLIVQALKEQTGASWQPLSGI